jgi:hypothetical protein
MPILVHDIAKEIPDHMQSMVKQAYMAWLVGASGRSQLPAVHILWLLADAYAN